MLGVCYYPEHWDSENWQNDADNMVQAGISWVRIGEFAWSRLQPQENQFDWDWLDTAIDILGKTGLSIVLGTPTATPPMWICQKHPDMFALDAHGNVRGFGSRRHYCFSHQGYQQESQRITEILAKRYGKNPYIKAWQTDNEYGCHNTALSYSDHAQQAFQQWLQQKYGDIDTLNTAWGNVFWSMEYTDFTNIRLPNLTTTKPNPTHVLDFKRFSSDQIVRFNKQQVDILRKYTHADLIHNYMGREMSFDHFAVAKDLDIASWDSYPLGFLEQSPDMTDAEKQPFIKQGDPDFQAFHHDLYRSVGNGRLWIMEQQPGPVNWAPYNPTPLDGMVRLWTWEALAHGAEVVSYFRWRQAPFAQEQMHAGLLRADGKKAPAYSEAQQVAQELATTEPLQQRTAPIAIVFDYDAGFMWQAQPQGHSFRYESIVFDVYRSFRRMGLNIDIIPPTADISAYKVVCIPALGYIPPVLHHRLNTYEGQVILGPRTGCKTENLHIQTPQILTMGDMSVTIERVESMRPNYHRPLMDGGYAHHWSEDIATDNMDTITHTFTDGRPAVIQGTTTTYLGGWFGADTLHHIYAPIVEKAGITIMDLPDGLRVRHTQPYTFIFNYNSVPVQHEGTTYPPASVTKV